MPFFHHDNIDFHYRRCGGGTPFFFQHGLGADVQQPFGLLTPPSAFELIAFDFRGHGQTRPTGAVERFSIPAFADDLAWLMDHLQIQRAVIGGISMGAAVALNLALRFPDRAMGLVLSRPAWLTSVSPLAAEAFPRVATLIRGHGPQRGKELFIASELYRNLLREAPDTAGSLAGQFDHPRARETLAKLERIPASSPCSDLSQLRSIAVPTLVLANRLDPVHPFEFGTRLVELIPAAQFRELVSKSIDKPLHERQVHQFIAEFLVQHWPSTPPNHGAA